VMSQEMRAAVPKLEEQQTVWSTTRAYPKLQGWSEALFCQPASQPYGSMNQTYVI
jgi:hypothetical protein